MTEKDAGKVRTSIKDNGREVLIFGSKPYDVAESYYIEGIWVTRLFRED